MKIYGTIGPACQDVKILTEMFQTGMTGVRLNVSHVSLREAADWIEHIHVAARENNKKTEILIDLQGPELRVGSFHKVNGYSLIEGGRIFLGIKEESDTIPVPEIVMQVLEQGQEVLLDDGKILLEVLNVETDKIFCSVLRGGQLLPRKSIALPGKQIDAPTLTKADIENIQLAKAYGVTGVMLPFVRGRQDIENLRQALENADSKDINIFAKIENQLGIDALEEIIESADEVVIARGDLGNAMPLWELPAIQKKIAGKCKSSNRKFMVVTQMLASMEHSKVPTRAEVSDVFNAVLDGADSVMLTGETAAGEYPVDAMEYMVKTVKEALSFKASGSTTR